MLFSTSNSQKLLNLLALLVIISFAILLRVIYSYQIAYSPEHNYLILDPQFNDYWAKRIIHGPSYPSPTGEDPMIENTPYGRPPAYPYLLSVLYLLFGEKLSTIRLIQTSLGICNTILFYFLANNLFKNSLAGIIASLLFSTLWQPIYFEQEINYPTWLTTVIILLIWSFYKYLLNNKTVHLLLSGSILGALALFRPNALILYPLHIAMIIYKQKPFCRIALKPIIIFSSALILTILPALVRNYIVSRELFLISCFGGINAYIGNNPYSTGDSPTLPQISELCGLDNWSCFNYRYLVAGLGIKQKGEPFSFSEASKFFYKKALLFWKDHPLKAISLTLRKFFLFWAPHIVSDGKVIQCEIEDTILKHLPGFPLLLTLFLFSISCLLLRFLPTPTKNESEFLLYLTSSAILYSLSVIPFFISERYKFPLIPYILLFSSGTISKILSNIQSIKTQAKLKLVTALIICTIFSQIPTVSYSPDKSRFLYHKALALISKSELKIAKDNVQKAININPKNHEYYLLLGTIHLQENDLDEAKLQFSNALKINPNSAIAHNNLGYIEELTNNLTQAQKLYEKSVNINPVYTLGWINLGRVYLYNLNLPNEANSCFLKAVEIDPNLWKTWFHLGNSYLTLGELTKAQESLTKAQKLDPLNPHILNNLGLTYYQMGKLEKAKEFFEKATLLDNTLPDPLFNLGMVYKKLSMPEKAKNYFEKTISLEPNYPGAKEELSTLEN